MMQTVPRGMSEVDIFGSYLILILVADSTIFTIASGLFLCALRSSRFLSDLRGGMQCPLVSAKKVSARQHTSE